MNKIVQANIGGFVFDVEEPGFIKLENYVRYLNKKHGVNSRQADDAEQQMAQLLREEAGSQPFLTTAMVDRVIGIMGIPDDFFFTGKQTSGNTSEKFAGFTRDTNNKILGGVCAGLARRFQVDTIWVRLAFFIAFFSVGFGFLLYILLWIIVPADH